MAKETYSYGKKRPIHMAKEAYHMAKETYSYGKRGLSYGKRDLFIWQKRPIEISI